ncbi:DUF4838 domain-containing protein [Ochrovirga pacifica]|uniref:DUF4838 domain-containing protein n=1 Tax=Ochrovirga pacifica TaxID=1042376 RepID=UPI000255987F|nr:DUF4838 domain-containing protein [Ochrovirga pacifica]
MRKIGVAFFMLLTILVRGQGKDLYVYQKGVHTPIIYMPKFSSMLTNPISHFQKEIKEKTGLLISFSPSKRKNDINFHFKIVKVLSSYNVVLDGSDLVISASDESGFIEAVDYLVNDYLVFTKDQEIKIPTKIQPKPTHNSRLKYREVYFSQNFQPQTRSFYKNQYLETEWGLWGHNIRKWVKKEQPSELIYALHNGERNSDQLCFSSVELEQIIEKNIAYFKENEPSLKRFMIAPDDNSIVCQCNLCKAKGNTKKNASPAVYSLLAQLAKRHTDLSFWSLGYVTTKTPPTFQLPKNVGVLLSTIDCQEALPLKETPKGKTFLNHIATWNSKIQNIFIWDYVVNFDNYMDFYPIYKSTQKNLKSYIEHGVTGVFLHGSGYEYSVAEEVKYHVLSRLMLDPNADVNQLIKEGVVKYYPELSAILTPYLINIENKAVNSQKKQHIYSGIKLANKRYLALEELESLLKELKSFNSEKTSKLKLALLYLQLELMHVNGLKNEGMGTLNDNNIQLTRDVSGKLSELERLMQSTGLNQINEKKDTFSNYVHQWKEFLKRIKNNPSFFNTSIRTFSTLDEDYNQIKVLNDGAFGFNNYNDNWLIFSGKELLINVNNAKFVDKKVTKLEIGFLSDVKHKIYLPSLIQVYDKSNNLVKEIPMFTKKINGSHVEILEILLPYTEGNFSYNLRFVNDHKSIAIDEIRFLR